MSIVKNNNFPLRFRTKTQKNTAKRLAKKNRSSLNEYILSLIDDDIQVNKGEVTKTNYRSAKTGEYVKEEFAAKHPNTTVKETDSK